MTDIGSIRQGHLLRTPRSEYSTVSKLPKKVIVITMIYFRRTCLMSQDLVHRCDNYGSLLQALQIISIRTYG